MNLPRRRKYKSGRDGCLRSPGHLAWIRGHECSVTAPGALHAGRIEACHVRTGTDGGTSLKPSDNFTLPLCALHHKIQHDIGEPAFERDYEIDMKQVAAALWQRSPHRRKAIA